MTSAIAEEELDRYFSSKDHTKSHPEDAERHSLSDEEYNEEEKSGPAYIPNDGEGSDDEDLLDHSNARMSTTTTSTYTLPSTLFDANTGPKGVIADAHAFEKARKKSFRRTLMNMTYNALPKQKSSSTKASNSPDQSGSEGDHDEEEFMRKWRENRLQELQSGVASQRRASPSKRRYGSLDDVDANGYLDAVEKLPSDTIVVVCIYDPESLVSTHVEQSLATLARRYSMTRFIKLHQEIADMDHVGVPAILAYKGGDVFSTIVNIAPELREVEELELLLQQNHVL
ncbi:putative phosducin family protein [Phaeomoniella chlamydospora]|uniref:Putative phosducin family protein n=1 Tax=Phaeomoniella chlamydospora TaxID=158046 RepID=A0A0G2GXN4_PHACM|nr:putative phosducin family protein [Phaeomoniella chlamydospora]